MSETTTGFTPGPWESGYAGGVTGPSAVWGNGKSLHPIAKRGGAGICGASVVALVQMKDPNWEANARLMASAPDLYAALKALGITQTDGLCFMDCYEREEGHYPECAAARAALAKAEGRT
jgi:hypothetical protein